MKKRLTVQAVLGTARRLGLLIQNNQGAKKTHRHSGIGVMKYGPTVGVESSNIAALVKLARALCKEGRSVYSVRDKRVVTIDEITVDRFSNGAFRVA